MAPILIETPEGDRESLRELANSLGVREVLIESQRLSGIAEVGLLISSITPTLIPVLKTWIEARYRQSSATSITYDGNKVSATEFDPSQFEGILKLLEQAAREARGAESAQQP